MFEYIILRNYLNKFTKTHFIIFLLQYISEKIKPRNVYLDKHKMFAY